jgi:putative membrane protein
MFQEAVQMSLDPQALLGFSAYLLGSAMIMSIFAFLYTRITPHKEFVLIREGNLAAAVALGGSLIGFALPVSNLVGR